MKAKEPFISQKIADLGDFGTREFVGAIADIRSALIDEAWFDRTSSSVTHINESPLGWELPRSRQDGRGADQFDQRWSAADHVRQQAQPEHHQELDFDR